MLTSVDSRVLSVVTTYKYEATVLKVVSQRSVAEALMGDRLQGRLSRAGVPLFNGGEVWGGGYENRILVHFYTILLSTGCDVEGLNTEVGEGQPLAPPNFNHYEANLSYDAV